MPFDVFILESALFLCLVQVLASLPTDPYFHPWREEPLPYRISHYPTPLYPPLSFRNFTRGPNIPPFEYYHSQNIGRDFPDGFQARSFEEPAEGYLNDGNTQNYGNSYSSHVKCGGNREPGRNIRTNVEPEGRIDERINFEETVRSETNIPNPRIVTPKGRRRPQGNSNKNENNFITTTEKTVTQTPKRQKRPRPSPSKSSGGDIVFPDGYQKKFVPRVSKCATKTTFCEHLGEEYPGEYINQVLKKEGAMFREFFGTDMISDPNITERINAPEENSLCPYRQEVVFPRAAQNKEDKWLFIVNQDQYVQGVTVEVCLNPESRCILTEGFPLGYTPYCKQKYIERRLVAIGEDGKPHSDSFRLPSCCSCVVKHETSARMAPLRTSRAAPAPPSPP